MHFLLLQEKISFFNRLLKLFSRLSVRSEMHPAAPAEAPASGGGSDLRILLQRIRVVPLRLLIEGHQPDRKSGVIVPGFL